MVTQFGMSEALGLRAFEARRSAFLEAAMAPRRDYGEETASAIDDEVERILDRAHTRVRGLLTERRSVLDAIAVRLLDKEVLDGDELRRLIADPAAVGPTVATEPPSSAC
jgi:cell division protease FtsH